MILMFGNLCLWQILCRFLMLKVFGIGAGICGREVSGSVFVGDFGGTVWRVASELGFFLLAEIVWEKAARGELFTQGYCPLGNCSVGTARREFTGHPLELGDAKVKLMDKDQWRHFVICAKNGVNI